MEFIKICSCCGSSKFIKNSEIQPPAQKQSKASINRADIIKQEIHKMEHELDRKDTEKHIISPKPSINKIITTSNKEAKDSYVSFANIKIEEDNKSNKEFDTEIINSHEIQLLGEIFYNKEIFINRFGLKNIKKRIKNGKTVFGVNQTYNQNSEKINDFNINYKNIHLKVDINESLFSIEFDDESDSYLLKVLSEKINILHYIDYEYLLPMNVEKTFYIGKVLVKIICKEIYDSNTVGDTDYNDKVNERKINIYVLNDNNKWDNYSFSSMELPIIIGRKNSNILIKDNSISKFHCTINYDERFQLFYIKDKQSTNGTFLQMNKNCVVELCGKMTFKINESKFEILEIE